MSSKRSGWFKQPPKQRSWWDDEDFDDTSSSVTTGQSWYSNYSFKKDKTNIIDPELDWFTQRDLKRNIDDYVRNLPKELQELHSQKAIPEEVVEDIFKSYSYHAEDIALINTEKPELAWKQKLLDKVSSHYLKTITRGNDLYSTIVTRNLHAQLLMLLKQYQDEQQQKGGGGGGGSGGKNSLEDMIDQMSDQDMDKAVQQAQDQATQQIQTIDKNLEDMVGGEQASKMITDIKTLDFLKDIETFSKMITVRPEQLSKFIKGCYKRIVSYYNANSSMYEEPFLEAEEVADLDELEQLMPIFRLANLEDLVVQSFKHNFKFDVYIDASGSMGDDISFGGRPVNLYNLCRYLTVKLNALGMVKNIYLFDGSVRKMKNVFELMSAPWGGGTNFQAVINNVKQTGMSSVILTDLCDHINEHNKQCYFIGVKTFRPDGTNSVLEAYHQNKQFMMFTAQGEFKQPRKGVDY